MTEAVEAKIRVRYAETDAMGVVYHSNHFIWFEVGRVTLMRELGFPYTDLETNGYHLPVVEARCEYEAPVGFDEVVVIRTTVAPLRNRGLHFRYQAIKEATGEVAARGETKHLFVDDSGKVIPIPEAVLEKLPRID
ncbi:MAG: acyl-CoA thioesterase [Candidatus Bipolaricaulia bacterium]